jgi:hypothetical protein
MNLRQPRSDDRDTSDSENNDGDTLGDDNDDEEDQFSDDAFD